MTLSLVEKLNSYAKSYIELKPQQLGYNYIKKQRISLEINQ